MNILVAMPAGKVRETFIPNDLVKRIQSMGQVVWNTSTSQLSTDELKEKIKDIDEWGMKMIYPA